MTFEFDDNRDLNDGDEVLFMHPGMGYIRSGEVAGWETDRTSDHTGMDLEDRVIIDDGKGTVPVSPDHVRHADGDGPPEYESPFTTSNTTEVSRPHSHVTVQCTDGDRRTCCVCELEPGDVTPDGRVNWPPSGECQ